MWRRIATRGALSFAGMGLAFAAPPNHWTADITGSGSSVLIGTARVEPDSGVYVGSPGTGTLPYSTDEPGRIRSGRSLPGTRITLEIAGAKPGHTMAWLVQTGDCGSRSSTIVGESGNYAPLLVGSSGRAASVASLPRLSPRGTYSVRIYRSRTGDTQLGCGTLEQGWQPGSARPVMPPDTVAGTVPTRVSPDTALPPSPVDTSLTIP
jgi:hypothetical protein